MTGENLIRQCERSYGKNVRLKHLQETMRRHAPFQKAVELGCREGWLIHNVDAREKIGYDLTPKKVFEDIYYIEGDILWLGKEQGNADLVVCSEVIEHIEDDLCAIEVMNNQLRKGGLLFLTTINNNIRVDKSEQDRRYGHIRRYGNELKTLLEGGGFKTIDFYPIRSPHYYRHKGDLEHYSISKDKQEGRGEASGWVYVGRKNGGKK